MTTHSQDSIQLTEDQARKAGVPLPARMEAQQDRTCPVPLDFRGEVQLRARGHARYALEGKLTRMSAMYDLKRALSSPHDR